MFSPQSEGLELLSINNMGNNNDSRKISDLSDHDAEVTNSNPNIVYATEDLHLNKSKSSQSDSTVSYCGIQSNSNLSGILNICASAIGVGCLTFPNIIANLGIINSIIIHIIVAISIYYSLELLRSFVVDTKYFSYSSMTETTLGKRWLMIYSFSSFIYCVSVNMNYLTLLYSLFESSFVSHSTFYGFIFLLATCSIEIFLCLYTSKTSKINLLSLITMFSYAILIIITVFEGILSSTEKYFGQKFSKKYLLYPNKDQGGLEKLFTFITAFIKYIYAYSYHCSFPTLIGNLKNVNASNSKSVHNKSFAILFISYLIIGFFGYLSKEDVPTVLFREYEDSNDRSRLSFPIKATLFIFLFSLIPSRYIIIRDGYSSLIGKNKLTYKKDLLITTLCLILSNGIVYMNEELFVNEGHIQIDVFSIMVDIFGGLFGVIVSFGLPAINYAAVNGKRKLKSLVGYSLTGVFLIVGLLSFGYSFYEMFFISNNEEDE
jgi:amino acid permease